jgi:CRP/FNR family transcriptional regulator
MPCSYSCITCIACASNLFTAVGDNIAAERGRHSASPITSSIHTIPARRTIYHPKEWSEYVLIICHGWAVSSISLHDGRRQILSILLSGDFVTTAGIFAPLAYRSVEAITDVVYRKFKRTEFRAVIRERPDLLEKLANAWAVERAQCDQLALDLGRRMADERIARLILNVAERLSKRSAMRGQTMDFPLRQRHIADATGLTPVHVSKVLRQFQKAGLVEINGRSLTIVDKAELQRISDWR